MIGRLQGRVLSRQPPWLLLDVGGVGYEVEAPMSTFYRLPPVGEVVALHTHLVVREDAHLLYGFAAEEERALFRVLIRVSGIGPRVALAILSGVSVAAFWQAVQLGDAALLTRLPGIGRKTADRLLMELRERAAGAVGSAPVAHASEVVGDALSEARAALTALGYKPAEVQRHTEAVFQDGMSTENIVRESLRRALRT